MKDNVIPINRNRETTLDGLLSNEEAMTELGRIFGRMVSDMLKRHEETTHIQETPDHE